jgi:hypothetical protein
MIQPKGPKGQRQRHDSEIGHPQRQTSEPYSVDTAGLELVVRGAQADSVLL